MNLGIDFIIYKNKKYKADFRIRFQTDLERRTSCLPHLQVRMVTEKHGGNYYGNDSTAQYVSNEC